MKNRPNVFLSVCVCVCRYYAICHPLRARHVHTVRRAIRLVVVFWIASLILVSPQLAIQRLEPLIAFQTDPGSTRPRLRIAQSCAEFFPDYRINVAYTMLTFCVVYVLPVLVMLRVSEKHACVSALVQTGRSVRWPRARHADGVRADRARAGAPLPPPARRAALRRRDAVGRQLPRLAARQHGGRRRGEGRHGRHRPETASTRQASHCAHAHRHRPALRRQLVPVLHRTGIDRRRKIYLLASSSSFGFIGGCWLKTMSAVVISYLMYSFTYLFIYLFVCLVIYYVLVHYSNRQITIVMHNSTCSWLRKLLEPLRAGCTNLT